MLRTIIEIDEDLCTGCGDCITGCAEGALALVNGKAKVVSDSYCDGLGACMGACPHNALRLIEREADPFDPSVLESSHAASGASCPGTASLDLPMSNTGQVHHFWPIKLELVSPDAPFLRGADLLIAADCAAGVSMHFHEDCCSGKVFMLACPKLGNIQRLQEKLTDILAWAKPRSLTVLRMEVPCCQNLTRVAMQIAGEITYSNVREEILSRDGSRLK